MAYTSPLVRKPVFDKFRGLLGLFSCFSKRLFFKFNFVCVCSKEKPPNESFWVGDWERKSKKGGWCLGSVVTISFLFWRLVLIN